MDKLDVDPLAGRQSGRSRCDPGLQRPSSAEAEAVRRLAAVRLDGRQGAGAGDRRRRRRIVSLCYTCTHGPYNEPGPGFLGPRIPRSGRWAPTRDDMVLNGVTSGPARRPQIAAAELRRLPPRGRCERHDARAWTPSPNRRWGCSPRRSWPTPSTSRKEDPRIVDRYGTGDPKIHMDGNGAPRVPQSLLMARRLVEAGARVVTLNYSKWDWHGGMNAEGRANNSIFLREAEDFPVFDQCVSALVEDLHQRGLDEGLHRRHLGRIRPHAEDQRPGRPRPLAAGELRPAGRRRHEDRPGDRRDRPHRRRSRQPPGHVRRSLRHAVPQPGHRRRTRRRSPISTAARNTSWKTTPNRCRNWSEWLLDRQSGCASAFAGGMLPSPGRRRSTRDDQHACELDAAVDQRIMVSVDSPRRTPQHAPSTPFPHCGWTRTALVCSLGFAAQFGRRGTRSADCRGAVERRRLQCDSRGTAAR